MIFRIAGFRKLVSIFLLLSLFSPACARGKARARVTPDESSELIEPDKADRVGWVRYYEALGASNKRHRPILMLYFTHDSCDPCQLMEKWTFTDNRVLQALQEFVPVRVKGDVEIQMVRRFNVQTFPMIIFAGAEEGEIDRKAGYRSADFLLQWMENVHSNRMTLKALEEELEQRPADAELMVKQAQNLLDADEIERALEMAQNAADIAPGDANVLALFASCYLRLNRPEAAEAAITAALQTDAQNEKARRLRVILLLKKAESMFAEPDYVRAIELFSDVLEIEPENFDALIGMGRAHMNAGETEEAFSVFRHAASVRPESPVPCLALGELYQRNSDDAMAEKEYLKAVELEPRYESPYFRLMELYEKSGRRDELMQMYERVLPIEPAGTHNEIAWLMATSKHSEIFNPYAAAKHALAAIELEPNPWYIDTLAEAYYAQGKHRLAIAIIEEAMAKQPEDIEYYQGQLEKFKKADEKASVPR